MILNKPHFQQSLLHRLHQTHLLAQDDQTLSYGPEILVRTLRDTYRLFFDKLPRSNTPALCRELGIALTEGQAESLLAWEESLRSEKKYQELSPNPQHIMEVQALLHDFLEKIQS